MSDFLVLFFTLAVDLKLSTHLIEQLSVESNYAIALVLHCYAL